MRTKSLKNIIVNKTERKTNCRYIRIHMPALSVLMSSLRVALLLIHSTYVVTAASAAPSVTIEQHGRTVTVESFARKFRFILSKIV